MRRTGPVYHADITEAGQGKFLVTGRDLPLEVVSADPEHDYAYELARTLGGRLLPQAGILFWRGQTPSISFSSVLRASRRLISTGESFPRARKRASAEESAAIRRRLAA